MFQFTQNESTASRRRIYFYAVDATDGYTNVTTGLGVGGSTTVEIFKNGVVASSPISPTFTHLSKGLWYYEFGALSGYLDTVGVLNVVISDALIRTVQLIGYVYAGDPLASSSITAADVWSYVTRDLTGSVTVGTINANVITATSIASNAITSAKIADASLTAAKFGDSALVIGSAAAGGVKAYLDAGSITAGVIATNAIDADAIATNAIDSDAIANSAITIRMSDDGTASEGRIVAGSIASDVWNALLASYQVADTFGDRVLRSTNNNNECQVTGSNHIAADIHQLQANVITAAGINTGAIDADALATDAVTEIADGILARDIGSGSNALTMLNERTVRSALRALRNKSVIVGSVLTVCKEDDVTATPAWTAAVSSSASADPVTGVDPD